MSSHDLTKLKLERILLGMEQKQTAVSICETIINHLATGKDARVVVATRTRATAFAPKHSQMFRVSGDELQMQSGRKWLTIVSHVGLLVNIRYVRLAVAS